MPLFEVTNFYDRIYTWFDFLTSKGCFIISYVIMPNHLHFILYIPDSSAPIHQVIGEGKRFMAYQIVHILKKQNQVLLLEKMKGGVTASEAKNKVRHKVFEDSFDCKACYSLEFIRQKINYIHINHIHPKWQLVQLPEEYVHSSASFYLTGEQGIYPVTHFLEF